MNYSIETNDLTKKFGPYTAVDHINVGVQAGEISGFLAQTAPEKRPRSACCAACSRPPAARATWPASTS